MIVPSSVRQKYDFVAPYVDRVAQTVRDLVFAFCEERGFAFAARKKKIESISEKIETGRFSMWRQLDDIFGCAIIVPTLSEEAEAVEFLCASFQKVKLSRRGGTWKDPDVFRFDSTRFVGRLRLSKAVEDESELHNILFEVQVRTAFEHAWAVATRAFSYKADKTSWRRFRLAAQMKAAVEQLDALVVGYDSISEVLCEHKWPILSAKSQLEESIKCLIDEGVIASEVAPESWTRFCENLWKVVDGATNNDLAKKVEAAEKAAEVICRRARELGIGNFPRSITLLQYCVGCLVEEGIVSGPVKDYTPLITREFLDLFPSVRCLGDGFVFD